MAHDMISFEEAYDKVMSTEAILKSERTHFGSSLFRVLAEEISSDSDVPRFDKSMMDGYACRYSDIQNDLEILETIQAGSEPTRIIRKNQCAKIMTGAKVPEGADCVIMVEYTERTGERTIRFTAESTRINISKRGEDIKEGEPVLGRGETIKPAHVAVLALTGNVHPLVYKLPTVGIVSTGSELVEPEEKTDKAVIRNTNAYQLISQVKRMGIEPTYYGIAADTEPAIKGLLAKSLSECDLTLVSGGVSMGDFDLVPVVMSRLGLTIVFDRIAIKPGKPTTFGKAGNKICLALPGNPVSSYIIFEILAKPLIRKMMGGRFVSDASRMELGVDIVRKKTDRDEIIPVRFENNNIAIPVEYHGSAHIHSLCGADGMTLVGSGIEEIEKGTMIDVRPI